MVYPISKYIVPPIYKLWLRKVDGIENIPKNKPFIIASNHTSYYETLLLPCIIVPKTNKMVHAFSNSYYWKNPITRYFLDLWQHIPVYVNKEKNSKQKNILAFRKALNYMKKGDLMMIFPEGRRTKGKLQKAYTGIAKLALKTKAPVLPCGVIDAHKVVPKGALFPRFARCEVNIGKPMHFGEYYKKPVTKKLLRKITTKIMKEIAKLSNQKYNF